jgi:hypothetical protein
MLNSVKSIPIIILFASALFNYANAQNFTYFNGHKIYKNSNWKLITTVENRQTFVDIKNIEGSQNIKFIYVKYNRPDTTEPAVSFYRKYSILCKTQEYALIQELGFDQNDLNGSIVTQSNYYDKKNYVKAIPKTTGDNYILLACGDTHSASSLSPSKSYSNKVLPDQIDNQIEGNLSISTDIPKRPGPPSAMSYEMMSIKASNEKINRLSIQIFSDGQAAIGINKDVGFFRHLGNGVFTNSKQKIIVDENSNQVSINGLIIENVTITKKERVKTSEQMSYGEKLNFPKPLSNAIDENDLLAACSSVANIFSKNNEWANKSDLYYAKRWSICADRFKNGNDQYFKNRIKWEEILDTPNERKYISTILERCQKDYLVSTSVNKIGNQLEERCIDVRRIR